MTYIPDAKAFTDAPQNLTILMKQRRRWMNGALFAALRVIGNIQNMLSCSRGTHGLVRQTGMFFYMLYFLTMQFFGFLLIGSFYESIRLFFGDFFQTLTDTAEFKKMSPGLWEFFNTSDFGFVSIFSFGYITLLVGTLFFSIYIPINKAVWYFRIIATVFSTFTIFSLIGIASFLANQGFYPTQKEYDLKHKEWHDVKDIHGKPIKHFSILTLSGVIMLCVYFLPMMLRPIDFLKNVDKYILGLISYLFLLPTFINVMQVYSMSNLHDVSWGNRPKASDSEKSLSNEEKKQKELKAYYKSFRTKFLVFWILCNIGMVFVIQEYATAKFQKGKIIVINDGSIGTFEIIAAYFAALVVYRVFFGGLHILKFKYKSNFL